MHLNQWDYVELLFFFHVVKIGDVLEEIGIQVFVLEGVVRLNKVGEFFDNQLVAVFFQHLFCYCCDVFGRKRSYSEYDLFLGCKAGCRYQYCCDQGDDQCFLHFFIPPCNLYSIFKNKRAGP